MIDIKQLSIGDWVQHDTNPCKIRSIIRKAAISDEEVVYMVELIDPQFGDIFSARLSSLKPLPLNADRMAAIGFERTDPVLFAWQIKIDETHRMEACGLSENYMALYYEILTDYGEWRIAAQMGCQSVHHLQRFVTMCNIHKEIKL